MNAKISIFVFCIEVIIYLLLYNLHDCTNSNTILELEHNFNIFSKYLQPLTKYLRQTLVFMRNSAQW